MITDNQIITNAIEVVKSREDCYSCITIRFDSIDREIYAIRSDRMLDSIVRYDNVRALQLRCMYLALDYGKWLRKVCVMDDNCFDPDWLDRRGYTNYMQAFRVGLLEDFRNTLTDQGCVVEVVE